ncbi:UNVERIFIED_CONTAM: hypothetical protein K2H54_048363 [Gekko kuhli]
MERQDGPATGVFEGSAEGMPEQYPIEEASGGVKSEGSGTEDTRPGPAAEEHCGKLKRRFSGQLTLRKARDPGEVGKSRGKTMLDNRQHIEDNRDTSVRGYKETSPVENPRGKGKEVVPRAKKEPTSITGDRNEV